MRLQFKATMLPTSHESHSLELDMDDDIDANVHRFKEWYAEIGEQRGAPSLVRIFDDHSEEGESRPDDDAVVLLSKAYSKPNSEARFECMLRGLNWAEYHADDTEQVACAIHHVATDSDSFDGDVDDFGYLGATDDLSDWGEANMTLQQLKDDCDGRIEDHVDWEAVAKSLAESDEIGYSGTYVIDGTTYYVRAPDGR